MFGCSIRTLMCLLLLMTTAHAQLQTPNDSSDRDTILLQGKLPLENYSPPSFKSADLGKDFYPHSESAERREGWVALNMMVDAKGKPYEIHVADSSGNKALEAAAIKAVETYEFEPARVGGVPVEAGINEFKFKFVLTDLKNAAGDDFVHHYEALSRAITKKQREKADKELLAMKAENFYEQSFYNLARFQYFYTWGSDKQQLEALLQALAYEKKAKFLPEAQFNLALRQLFALQVKGSDFAAALESYNRMNDKTKHDPEVVKIVAEINALRDGGSVFSARAQLPASGAKVFKLLKRHFSVLVTDGHLAEIKLYCSAKFVLIPYERDLDYAIPPEYGACTMQLIGDQNTQLTIIQS